MKALQLKNFIDQYKLEFGWIGLDEDGTVRDTNKVDVWLELPYDAQPEFLNVIKRYAESSESDDTGKWYAGGFKTNMKSICDFYQIPLNCVFFDDNKTDYKFYLELLDFFEEKMVLMPTEKKPYIHLDFRDCESFSQLLQKFKKIDDEHLNDCSFCPKHITIELNSIVLLDDFFQFLDLMK